MRDYVRIWAGGMIGAHGQTGRKGAEWGLINNPRMGEGSAMARAFFAMMWFAACCGLAAPAGAAAWEASGQRDKSGAGNAYVSVKQSGHVLGFSCRQGGAPALQMTLTGKSFANLYAADDVEAVLTLRFDLPGGAYHTGRVKAWYFGPDQAWTGKFAVDANILNSFAHAESLSLLNPKGQLVLKFPMAGSARAVKIIRRQCRIGLQ